MRASAVGRVTIVAIGVEEYKNMHPLKGPKTDVENFYKLLVKTPKTALYHDKQFFQLINPTSSEIREFISHYTSERTALGDILVFYFSGHGVPVGHKDFGFCTLDTDFHPNIPAVLPLTVFRFSELMEALSIVDVAPVIVIDSCYSGKAGDALVSSTTAINSMHEKIKTVSASNAALLCSCSDIQTSLNSSKFGGLFSKGIAEVGQKGVIIGKQTPPLLGLKELYRPLVEFIEQEADDSAPRLYIGDTLLDFPLIKNVKYSSKPLSFGGDYKSIIVQLWNNGKPRELQEKDILTLCGQGAYCNHNKLSLDPWNLVEDAPKSFNRRLTQKGLLFAEGKIKIPKSIEKNPITGKWEPKQGTKDVAIGEIHINQKTRAQGLRPGGEQ